MEVILIVKLIKKKPNIKCLLLKCHVFNKICICRSNCFFIGVGFCFIANKNEAIHKMVIAQMPCFQ